MSTIRVAQTPPDHVVVEADYPTTTPQQVFEYFVRPDLLIKWWPQEAESDARQGGSYHVAWPGMNWHLRGVYHTFIPGEKLTFAWNWDHQPSLAERTVEIIFAPAAQGTQVTIRHGDYDSSPPDQADRQSHIDGWRHFLAQLQQILADKGN